jgi:DNA-binding IclR family transcriptional regulator
MEQMVSPNETSTRTVVRAAHVLRALGAAPEGCSLTELATSVELSKATVSRLLQTLICEGFVASRGKSGPYVIGADFIRIAMKARKSSHFTAVQKLEDLSKGPMQDLRDQTLETVALVMRQGDVRTNVAVVLGAHELIAVPKVGTTLPLHLGGPGKLFMAFLGSTELEQLADRSKQSHSPMQSFVYSHACRAELQTIKAANFATSFGEAVDGQASIAAPVMGEGGLLAVLNLIVPTVRFTDATQAKFLPHVQAAAAKLTALVQDVFDNQTFQWSEPS